MEDGGSPESEPKTLTLRAELVKLRERRGMTVRRVAELAPILMHLPCVDAEMKRCARPEEERAAAAVAAVWCLIENGGFDAGAQELLRKTLNFDVSLTTLGQRRADLYERLKTFANVKQYQAYEQDVYEVFAVKLEQAERSPCDTGGSPGSPGTGAFDIEGARRGIRGLLEVGIASFFGGENERAYTHLREIIEEYAPRAAQRFFPRSFDFSQGWVALLRTLAGSIYPNVYKFQREAPGVFLPPPEILEFMPSLPVLLTPRAARATDTPSAVWHLSRSELLVRLNIRMDDVDELVRDTAHVVADLILDREQLDGWERSIAAALHRPEQPAEAANELLPADNDPTTGEAKGRSAFEAGA